MRLQRFALTPTIVAATLAGLVSCQEAQDKPAKIVVVFVDVSASVREFSVHHDSWAKVLNRLGAGDRIILGRITGETFTNFRPVVDETLPKYNWLTDNKLRYEKKIKESKQKLTTALDDALASSRSQKTDILNSLTLAEKILHDDKRQRVLVIISDMLEDGEFYNFERVRVDQQFTRKVIEDKHRKGEMPDLKAAKVYVAGASAPSANKALEIQRFWVEYFKAANAHLPPQNYGPTLINFDE
jgi:hypothetical protein